ncbi:MAG: glycosyltransferase family 4 protein [Desulfobulbaceae bacterium]|nr:glycosyltransferase family 4 protein [Desulfobulbaceae bacterium]
MLKFALITSHAPSLVHFRAPLIKNLRKRGVHVFALAPNFDDKTRARVQALGATPVDYSMSRTGMNPFRDFLNAWQLARLLKRLQPDTVLNYFIKPVIFGSLAARWAGVPCRLAMIEGLGFIFTPGPAGFSFKRRVLKRLVMLLYKLGLSCGNKIIFLNPDDRDEFIAARLLPVSKAFLLGGIGVDLAKWPFVPPVSELITFLMVGRLLREKGVEDYVNAARMVKKMSPPVRFILLGDLDDNPGAIKRSEVQAWNDEGIVEWYGHVPVQPWLAQASVFVLPSYREGVPVSTQEALATGRPVITTNVPGCRQTVIDGVNGFLVPVHNAEYLAEKMMEFIRRPELISTMGLASRQHALEHYDVHKVNKRLIKLILPKTCEPVT